MSYYSTDSEEHKVSVGDKEAPDNYDWVFDDYNYAAEELVALEIALDKCGECHE